MSLYDQLIMSIENANTFNILVYIFLFITCIVFIRKSIKQLRLVDNEESKHHIIAHILDTACIVIISISYIFLAIRRNINNQRADNDIRRSLLELFIAYRFLATVYHYQREQDEGSSFYIVRK